MADHRRIVVRALTWNLFHGRDFPPDPALFTLRSRLLRISERDAGYVQVNRPLRHEFTEALARLDWQLALLQEAPPRWFERIRGDLGADGALALTSRNRFAALRGALADLNPDLVASGEGGSNQLLVRPPWRIAEVRRETIARRPERRAMLLARLESESGARLAVANLHGSVDRVEAAPRQVVSAAALAAEWAAGRPLVFGGDLNLRPARHAEVFSELERRFGLGPPTDADAIDHLLARGLEVVEPPHRLPDEVREVSAGGGRRIRLSDHPCVAAAFGVK